MQHLLVVDDDRGICSLLAEQLVDAGYQVATALSGAEMRRKLERLPIDLIILDLNLRNEDGLTLCRELRAHTQVPVVMLTARSAPIDRILGLEMGADDYLAKPFEPRELIARIRSVLRRTAALPANFVEPVVSFAFFDGWTVNFLRRALTDPANRMTILSNAETRLIKIFATHPMRVISREQLIALGAVGSSSTLDRAIDLQVSRLRQKFGAAGMDLIKTVRHGGYMFSASVELQ